MGLPIKDIKTGGGGFFKPADYLDSVAFLIEVYQFERQRPGNYGPKDSALCDLTVFGTQESLDGGEPTEIRKGVRIENSLLAKDLEQVVGAATVVKLGQWQGKKAGAKPAWVWQQVSQDTKSKVVAYADAREAAIQAALDSAPDFD